MDVLRSSTRNGRPSAMDQYVALLQRLGKNVAGSDRIGHDRCAGVTLPQYRFAAGARNQRAHFVRAGMLQAIGQECPTDKAGGTCYRDPLLHGPQRRTAAPTIVAPFAMRNYFAPFFAPCVPFAP